MIPVLYSASETAFTTQGLGALADAVSASIQRVINGKDELTMVYPSTGIRYSDLANDRIIYATPEYKKTAQPYQIYKITKPMNGLVTVYARHVGSQRTQYIPVVPFTAGSLTETLNTLPTKLVETSPFTFWTNKTVTKDFNLDKPASLGNVLGGMSGSILDTYGGEYEFDGYTVKLWNRRGADNGVELRYGKNITDIEQSEDFASIITGVVPYWSDLDGNKVSLPEVVVQGTHADDYAFRRTIVKDFSENFDEQPTEAQLRAAAQSYLTRYGTPTVNLKVSFEHLAQYAGYENLQLLEQVNLGDTVHIFYEPLNLTASARVAKTTYDCLNDKYTSVQIGSVRSDLEQVIKQTNDTAVAAKDALGNVSSAVQTAVENATDLLTGANGGYVILDRDANGKPYQILIMDTDDKTTATNVIRLNQNGIGFSTSGYSGPFTTAWTIDSNFVADFITTGVLNAALAKIGLLADAAGKNSWNMDTGDFTITDGKLTATFIDLPIFYRSDYDPDPNPYTNPDRINLSNIIQRGAPFTQEELDKYDFYNDGTLSDRDLSLLREMIYANKDRVASRVAVIDPREQKIVRAWDTEFRDTPKHMTEQSASGFSVSLSSYGTSSKVVNKAEFTARGINVQAQGINRLDLDSNLGLRFWDYNGNLTGVIGTNCNDYVVETGMLGLWNYRKWNSGVCECLCRYPEQTYSFTPWGTVYYCTIPAIAYPFEFSSVPLEIASIYGGNSAWYGKVNGNTTTMSWGYECYRPVSGNASVGIEIYVAGMLA